MATNEPQQYYYPYATPEKQVSEERGFLEEFDAKYMPRIDVDRAKELAKNLDWKQVIELAKQLLTRKPGHYGKIDPGSLYGAFQENPAGAMSGGGMSLMMGGVRGVPGASSLSTRSLGLLGNMEDAINSGNSREAYRVLDQMMADPAYSNYVGSHVRLLQQLFPGGLRNTQVPQNIPKSVLDLPKGF